VTTTENTMLQPILQSLNSKRIILASTSPRRKLLLENVVSLNYCVYGIRRSLKIHYQDMRPDRKA